MEVSKRQKHGKCSDPSQIVQKKKRFYQPSTEDTKEAYQALLSLIDYQSGTSFRHIVAQEILSILKCKKTLNNPIYQRVKVEELLKTISDDIFDQLVLIAHNITDFTGYYEYEEDTEQEVDLVQVLEETLLNRGNEDFLKLPLDIFLDIFSRLPIKPLAACRCVCKTWHKIVHHPRFVQMHHRKATTQPCSYFNSTTSLVFNTSIMHQNSTTQAYNHADLDFDFPSNTGRRSKFHKESIGLLEHETDDSFDNAVLINPPFCSLPNKFTLVVSCNGLLCLHAHSHRPRRPRHIYIWNPVLGEYITLLENHIGSTSIHVVSGFGFDSVADKYKVIHVFYKGGRYTPFTKHVAEVYTLGSGKWRKLGNVPRLLRKDCSQVSVSGALHWLTDSVDNAFVAFDVVGEEFRVIPPPPGLNASGKSSRLILGDLGGCLCLLDQSFDDRCEIWVMRNYGVKSSWTKEFVIPQHIGGFNIDFLKLITVRKNGNLIMLLNYESLVCYDPTRKILSEIEGIHQRLHKFDALSHVGTFLSLEDIVRPTHGKLKVSSGKWYGTLRQISSHKYSSI